MITIEYRTEEGEIAEAEFVSFDTETWMVTVKNPVRTFEISERAITSAFNPWAYATVADDNTAELAFAQVNR